MIDFIKIRVLGIIVSELLNNPELNFCGDFNPNTGEMRAKKQNDKNAIPYLNAYFKGLEFRIYDSGSVYILGSIHKYWNNGGHNYNDFNINSVYEVLNDIQERFNITPQQMKINQLEIGVNFIPPYPTKELLKYCFLHRTTPFVWKHNSDEGKYIQAEHSQYIIKIYDKARHYRSKGFEVPHPEIMRFEIKYRKLEKVGRGIKTIYDLLQYGIENFIPELTSEWQKILFYDFTINHNSKSLLNYSNPIYWQELTARESAFRKHRSKLNKFISEHSENIPLQIENIIQQKGIELTKRVTVLTENKNTQNKHSKNTKGNVIDHLSIQSKPTPSTNSKDRFCIITGLNISMQRKGSKMLSISGLKYYRNTEKNIFNELKRKYLTDYWKNADITTELNEIYHNIRNTKSNRKIKQKRLYPKSQLRLSI